MEKQFWDRFAPVYDRFMKKDEAAYREICSLIKEKADGKKVLEVCTGTGLIAKEVADVTEYMYALDYSAKMMESARQRAQEMNISNIRFVQGDVGALPFEDSSFDIVVSLNGFHAFPDKEAAYRETFRVLKPGGQFISHAVDTPSNV